MDDSTKIAIHIIFIILTFSILACFTAHLFVIGKVFLAHLSVVWFILSTIWNFVLLGKLAE